MKLFITGAHSPSGRATLARALGAGHQVRLAIAASQPPPDRWLGPECPREQLSWVPVDWLEESGVKALEGMDAVLHLEEVESGPFERHFLGTVQTTERLLQDMCRAGVRRLVLRSSLAVYGYRGLGPGHWLAETSPLEPAPERRSPYVQAKLMQEALLVSFGQCWGGQSTILRPGLIYGPGQLLGPAGSAWVPAGAAPAPVGEGPLGSRASTEALPLPRPWAWEIAPHARLPLLYVDHFAEAVLAALAPAAIGETFNLVDDDLPSRRQYCRAIAPLRSLPWRLPCPWFLAQLALSLQDSAARVLGQAGEVTPAQWSAQVKPLGGYSNIKAKRMLGWGSCATFDGIIARIAAQEKAAQSCAAAIGEVQGGAAGGGTILGEAEAVQAVGLNPAAFNPGSRPPRPPAGQSALSPEL